MANRTTIAGAILAAAALAGGYLATQDSPVCELHTVFGPCEELGQLLGADTALPACDAGETIGAVLALKLIGAEAQDAPPLSSAWLQPPGVVRTPVDCNAYTWPSDAPEDRVQVVPVEMVWPESIVGMVGRLERRTTGPDGTDLVTPAEDPHLGHCYGDGCYCASADCEHYAVGSSDPFYWFKRLCRGWPDAEGCDVAAAP